MLLHVSLGPIGPKVQTRKLVLEEDGYRLLVPFAVGRLDPICSVAHFVLEESRWGVIDTQKPVESELKG